MLHRIDSSGDRRDGVVFVCEGNTCRSPMAQLYAQHDLGLDRAAVFSAGLAARAGAPAADPARMTVAGDGLDLADHGATPLADVSWVSMRWAIAMTRSQALQLRSAGLGRLGVRIGVLGAAGVDIAAGGPVPECEEVADPWGGDAESYRRAAGQIRRLLQDWKPHLAGAAPREGADGMIIAMGSDHRGYGHKQAIAEALQARGVTVEDFGCHSEDSADYPEAAFPVGEMVARGDAAGGILICGSGIGVSIAANKVRGVRASLCFTEQQAATTRQHNDSNVLCLSGDGIDIPTALRLVEAWLGAAFEGGRHQRRVDLITGYEADHCK
jgi:ribose 5-phosphate isomerase B